MTDLTTHPIVQTSHNRRFTYVAFYVLPQGINHFIDIPEGGEFGIIHTPVFRDDQWTYTRWEVIIRQYKNDYEPSRYYRVKADRELIDDERERFEGIVNNAILWEIQRSILLGLMPMPLLKDGKP